MFGIRFSFIFEKYIEFNARSHFRTTFNDVKLTLNIISNAQFLAWNKIEWNGSAIARTPI